MRFFVINHFDEGPGFSIIKIFFFSGELTGRFVAYHMRWINAITT